MEGSPLKQVIRLSGMPEDQIEPWFAAQVESRGKNPYDLNLEGLREILADILQDLILESESA